MACLPSLSFTKLGHGPNTLEIYLDLLCPFSKKTTLALNERLVPALLDDKSELSKSLTLFIRPYPQPWHPNGSYLAESVLAFGRSSALSDANETKRVWWAFFVKLMQEQGRWFNGPVKDKTAEQVRDELASLAGDVLQAENAIKGPASKAVGEIRDLIALKPDSPNSGSAVTDDLKYFIKLGRQNAIHVTPSAVFNGLFESSVSSSWTDEQWNKFFKSKGVAKF